MNPVSSRTIIGPKRIYRQPDPSIPRFAYGAAGSQYGGVVAFLVNCVMLGLLFPILLNVIGVASLLLLPTFFISQVILASLLVESAAKSIVKRTDALAGFPLPAVGVLECSYGEVLVWRHRRWIFWRLASEPTYRAPVAGWTLEIPDKPDRNGGVEPTIFDPAGRGYCVHVDDEARARAFQEHLKAVPESELGTAEASAPISLERSGFLRPVILTPLNRVTLSLAIPIAVCTLALMLKHPRWGGRAALAASFSREDYLASVPFAFAILLLPTICVQFFKARLPMMYVITGLAAGAGALGIVYMIMSW